MLLAGVATLGSYTTFSTWMLESHRLGEDGELGLAAANLAGSLLAGVAAAAAGLGAGGRAVNQDCLKLTSYFAEHDKTSRRFLADALLNCYGRHRWPAACCCAAPKASDPGSTCRPSGCSPSRRTCR
jgi:hypothetical protein